MLLFLFFLVSLTFICFPLFFSLFFVDRERKGRLSGLFFFFFYSTYGHTHQQRNREVDREELKVRERDLGLPPCKAKRAGIFFLKFGS
jgi:hypothetical protein